jgi:hypothetical protein
LVSPLRGGRLHRKSHPKVRYGKFNTFNEQNQRQEFSVQSGLIYDLRE